MRTVTALAMLMLSACSHAGPPQAVATTPAQVLPSPAPGKDNTLQLQWDGVARSYQVHTPGNWSAGQRLPLVVALHGYNEDAAQMRQMTQLDALSDQYGFLLAYPEGIDGNWTALYCCRDNDDVGFIHAMVDQLTQAWGVDTTRIYATGFSQGAELTYRLAVELPGMFAAIAPVSAGFDITGVAAAPSYRPTHPVSVITVYGTEDPYAPTEASGVHDWSTRVHCSPVPTPAPTWTGQQVAVQFRHCTDGSDHHTYVLSGLGHQWPRALDLAQFFDASTIIWQFFSDHPSR